MSQVKSLAEFLEENYSLYSYKGYTLEPHPIGWCYTHLECDGPEDKRHGYGKTVAECLNDIDEVEGWT